MARYLRGYPPLPRGNSRPVKRSSRLSPIKTNTAPKRRPDSNACRKSDTNPQLSLILSISPHYGRSQPLPYEIMMKIFHEIIRTSNHPIRDLCNLANVCESWRLVILQTPSLWSRINFNQLPLTDGNIRVLSHLVDKLPAITNHIREASLCGPVLVRDPESLDFLEKVLTAPRLNELTIDRLESQGKTGTIGHVLRAISKSRQIRRLSIKNTRQFALTNNQKWLTEFLAENGHHLEELHLTSSLNTVTSKLCRALASDFCPSLRVLDLSTYDSIRYQSLDAIKLAETMPNLVILRAANVSFKRVYMAPEIKGLSRLEELSMPISMRDTDRDDPLFATLAYGSDRINSLDLRGSSISPSALMGMLSYNVRELHIDDMCPLGRGQYGQFIRRWQHSLRVVSLVKINCSNTIRACFQALVKNGRTNLRELDLDSSDVTEEDLKWFLGHASSLEMINLSSCRSLPRGCKGRYGKAPSDTSQLMHILLIRMGLIETHSDSDTEIDEENSMDSLEGELPRKRKRVPRRLDPVYNYDY